MAQNDTVWGIDIGQCALKALKLRSIDGDLRVEAFDVIDHPKILSQPDADRELLIRNALEKFLARNNVIGSSVVVSAPGQAGFTRFVKLPPVETKQIPEIVRFEAEQQIPFDINEVIWRWQTFLDPDSPDIEVGIFAMKRLDVADVLDGFADVGIDVDVVQMAPLALYNFMEFDGQSADDGGTTLLVDVGADKTDLVISDGPRIWTRTLQLGGSNFTEALVKVFKLSFTKAEKLKRTAATSKYARQIFQAMRPVFAELVQEIQRSIGYYTSLHRESRFKHVIGLGNGFRLPGLQKFLEQNLGLTVVRIDSYNRISPSATVNAPAFTENVLSFAVAYGLALQGLGLTKIQSNLLPTEIARQRLWSKKRWWFAGAGAAAVVGLLFVLYGASTALSDIKASEQECLQASKAAISSYSRREKERNRLRSEGDIEEAKTLQYQEMLAYRDYRPTLLHLVNQAISMQQNIAQQSLTPSAFPSFIEGVARKDRRVVIIKEISSEYHDDIMSQSLKVDSETRIDRTVRGRGRMESRREDSAQPPSTGEDGAVTKARRGYILRVRASTPLQPKQAAQTLATNVLKGLEAAASGLPNPGMFSVVAKDFIVDTSPSGGMYVPAPSDDISAAPAVICPFTGEDAGNDMHFTLSWKIVINDRPSPGEKDGSGGAK